MLLLPTDTWNAIEESDLSSPQSQAYQWLLEDPNFPDVQDWQKFHRFSLATFYFAFEGPKWPSLTQKRWLNEQNECNWFSQEFFLEEEVGFNENPAGAGNISDFSVCNKDGRYRVLSLRSVWGIYFITGNNIGLLITMPTDIELIASLEELSIENSVLFSSLDDLLDPPYLARLPNLTKISLFQNGLTGTLTTNIGVLTQLVHLNLSRNNLQGSIPNDLTLLTSLEELHLDFNGGLSGSTHIFSKLTSLRVLRARGLSITGTIATELGKLRSLQILSLSGNWITGELPMPYFLEMSNLSDLGISNNYITGTVHSSIGLLNSLKELWMGGNYLTGRMASEIGLLASLKSLGFGDVEDYKCAGIDKLSDAQTVLCSKKKGNNFTGSLATELGLLKKLKYLIFQENRLSITIPSELGLLTELAMLNLLYNEIVGDILSKLTAIPSPFRMQLMGNELSGSFSLELCPILRKTEEENNILQVNCSTVDCAACNCTAR